MRPPGALEGAFRVVPLCRLAMFLNQVRKNGCLNAVKAADFFYSGRFHGNYFVSQG